MRNIKLDEISYWSEVKLDIVRKYAKEYSKIISAQANIKRHLYIDAFAGAGVHISKRTKGYILGSPLNALNVSPPFKEFHFIDLDGDKAEALREQCTDHSNIYVYQGDCNVLLLEDIFPCAKFTDYRRALCLLDPYGLDLDWQVVYRAGQMKSIEIFLNFPMMDMNRNVLLKNPDKIEPSQVARMDRFWGDRTWRDIAYRRIPGLFEEMEEKTRSEAIVNAYQSRLKKIAGFAYVTKPIPMRNSKGTVVYYLFFSSPNKTGEKIVKYIFEKYRNRGIV